MHPFPCWRQDNRPAAANAMCSWGLLQAWATQASEMQLSQSWTACPEDGKTRCCWVSVLSSMASYYIVSNRQADTGGSPAPNAEVAHAQAAFAALPRDITQSVRLFTLGEESEAGLEGDDKPEVSLEALMSDAKARVSPLTAQMTAAHQQHALAGQFLVSSAS